MLMFKSVDKPFCWLNEPSAFCNIDNWHFVMIFVIFYNHRIFKLHFISNNFNDNYLILRYWVKQKKFHSILSIFEISYRSNRNCQPNNRSSNVNLSDDSIRITILRIVVLLLIITFQIVESNISYQILFLNYMHLKKNWNGIFICTIKRGMCENSMGQNIWETQSCSRRNRKVWTILIFIEFYQ